jgi:hypothetical protein
MSFLTAADWADLAQVKEQGWETIASAPGQRLSLVLSRWNPVQDAYVALPAQDVTMKRAARQVRASASDAAETVSVDGWFTRPAPFDVENGDLFSLTISGGEQAGKIVDTAYLPDLGIQRADFELRLGEM